MAVVYKLDEQGGFTCGDTESRLTSYAYPTSTYAVMAKKRPMKTAHEMLKSESATDRDLMHHVREYDARNWARLGATN